MADNMTSADLAAHARQLLDEASDQNDFGSDAERYYLSAAGIYATLSQVAAMQEMAGLQRQLLAHMAPVAANGGEPS
jgi:hypothetical protein